MPECALISWVLAAMPADAQVASWGICHLPQQQIHKEQLHFGQESRSSALLAFPQTVLFTFPSHLDHLRSEVWLVHDAP